MLTRFAPSPTGLLHLGHAHAATQAFGFDKSIPFLLRIEDIDKTRCRPEYRTAIYEDLDWLGFDWPIPVRVQSQHKGAYLDVIHDLNERGLLYRCFKTRKDLSDSPPAPLPKAEVEARLADKAPFAWRLSIEACQSRMRSQLGYTDTGHQKTVNLSALDDVVLARKDIDTSYHIAVTHDDMIQNITHVVRGADFIEQTPYHVLIQHLMGWPTPIYHHHALLLRDDGEKLSKRHSDTTIRSLRENSLTAQQVLDMSAP